MKGNNKGWTRWQLLVAFGLYCQMPFGKLHSRNPEIIKFAERIGRTPSALAMKLTNIASLDPAITSTGRKGLSGASASDKEMWEEMQSDWERFAIESESALTVAMKSDQPIARENDLTGIEDYSGAEKVIKAKARIRQNFFRRAVLSAYNYKCCITGLAIPELLVASHIIPWRTDERNRLNPSNGLALSMLHDKAFDIGLITINDDMTLRVSDVEYPGEDSFYKIAIKYYENKPIALPEKFPPLKEFLYHHRQHVFRC
ncbi:MAG: restriction endonuclease [Gammaproteobacteria bacterium]|nr:restriction endonuclease [Gammaproteobacteria bacterium]